MNLGRRNFLRGSTLLGAGALASRTTPAQHERHQQPGRRQKQKAPPQKAPPQLEAPPVMKKPSSGPPFLPVETPDDATVCAIVVRPRAAREPLPALLQFTIYADSIASMRDALLSAANGYVGVTGFTRGKACSTDVTVPYVHDGADATALIDWIAAQSWSDGRVGMYGGSYSGFTAWAAAKHMPRS